MYSHGPEGSVLVSSRNGSDNAAWIWLLRRRLTTSQVAHAIWTSALECLSFGGRVCTAEEADVEMLLGGLGESERRYAARFENSRQSLDAYGPGSYLVSNERGPVSLQLEGFGSLVHAALQPRRGTGAVRIHLDFFGLESHFWTIEWAGSASIR